MKNRNITKDFLAVIIIVIFGKLLGFIRELVVAYLYGASSQTDAFYYTNGLITSIFTIITTGLAQAFTPVYLDIKIKRESKESNYFANSIETILLATGILAAVLLSLFPNECLNILAPDLSDNTKKIAANMLKIMCPCVPLYIAFSIRKCILNANQKYMVTEASGIPYSIALAGVTFVLFSFFNSYALPVAAVVGVLCQWFFTFAFSKNDYRYQPEVFSTDNSAIKRYFILLIPIAASALFDEANSLLRKALAAGMGDGAIANLNYCMTLTTIINGVVITSLTTVYYPHLIEDYSSGKVEKFKEDASKCISLSSAMVVPLVAFLALFSHEVVKIVYERGMFTANDTIIVSQLFSIYSLGAIVYAYRYTLRIAFYSVQDTRSPVINELVFLVITMSCNIFQVKVLGLGLNSLGIAWIIAMVAMTPILYLQFRKKHFGILNKNTIKETIKSFIATLLFSGVLIVLNKLLFIANIYFRCMAAFILALLIYIISMIIMKSVTMHDLIDGLINREGA